MSEPCKCNCGYTCGGPGRCALFEKDAIDCIEKHHVRDCEHDFTGPWIEFKFDGGGGGGSVSCKKCGETAMDHDCRVGP